MKHVPSDAALASTGATIAHGDPRARGAFLDVKDLAGDIYRTAFRAGVAVGMDCGKYNHTEANDQALWGLVDRVMSGLEEDHALDYSDGSADGVVVRRALFDAGRQSMMERVAVLESERAELERQRAEVEAALWFLSQRLPNGAPRVNGNARRAETLGRWSA